MASSQIRVPAVTIQTASRWTAAWITQSLATAAIAIVLFLGSGIMLAPLLWTISTSLRLPAESFSVPPQWIPTDLDTQNYLAVFQEAPFAIYAINSLKIALAIVVGQLATASTAGYAFAHLRFPGRNVLFIVLMTSLMIPLQATIIPVFILIRFFGLADSPWALILPSWTTAFGVFFLRQVYLTMPKDLVDAAKIDGASQWQIFTRIFLPLSVTQLAVLAILSFNGNWNDFFRPLIFLSSRNNFTIPLGLVELQGYYATGSIAVVLAAVVLSMLPVLLIYLFAQRYVVEGIARTGVKG